MSFSFKNLKIGKKLYIGFGALIVLAGLIAFFGWNGLTTVSKKVELADDANRFVKEAQDTRISEKNFILRGDEKYIEEVREKKGEITDQVKDTEAKLHLATEKEEVRKIGDEAEAYIKAFEAYVAAEEQKTEADKGMVAGARAAIVEIENIRADQKAKLLKEMDEQQTSESVKNRLAKADDANRLNKYILEARRQEKNFIIRGDQN